MAGTSASFTRPPSSGLPAPKVQLAGFQGVKTQNVQYGAGAGVYELWRYPVVSVMDLTDSQIEQGVWVEMLAYRPHKSPSARDIYTNAREAGYVVPAPQIGGVNPLAGLGGGRTRGGGYTDLADRPNHYKVLAHGQQVEVWQYLHNRHYLRPVIYSNSSGGQSIIDLLHPTTNYRSSNYQPGITFGYQGRYRPYYFCFRYVMLDSATGDFVSGPLSKIVKLTHKVHPFKRNYTQSGVFGRTVNDIDPLFDVSQMACQFETRTPGGKGN